VSETLLEALVDMRHYIKCGIEPAESCPACVRYDALQVEVMKAIGEIEKLRAELAEARNRISQLEAARIGYAKEFPVDDEGLPDAGSIHQNIRKLKAELAEARRDSELLDWLEAFVAKNRVEIARSLYGSGFEFGWYPKSGPTAIARAGGIRVVLDAARKETP